MNNLYVLADTSASFYADGKDSLMTNLLLTLMNGVQYLDNIVIGKWSVRKGWRKGTNITLEGTYCSPYSYCDYRNHCMAQFINMLGVVWRLKCFNASYIDCLQSHTNS